MSVPKNKMPNILYICQLFSLIVVYLQTAVKTVLLVAEVQMVVGVEGIVPLAYLDVLVQNRGVVLHGLDTDMHLVNQKS
jgi:hypothetical protein